MRRDGGGFAVPVPSKNLPSPCLALGLWQKTMQGEGRAVSPRRAGALGPNGVGVGSQKDA